MQNYLYLLRKDNDSLNSFSADEKEQHMGRFFTWMESIKKKERKITSILSTLKAR